MKLYYYNHRDRNQDYKLEQAEDLAAVWRHPSYRLQFKSPFRSCVKENDTVHCDIIAPRGINGDSDLIIFIHGFSTSGKKLDNYSFFMKEAAARGYACAFIHLPYHLNRTPGGSSSGSELIGFNDIQTLLFFHQAVVDIRRLAAIAGNFNFKDLYICGLSLGSMAGTVALANEPKIKKGALLIGGGHWEEIHWNGILRFILKGNCETGGRIDRHKCHKYYSLFPEFIEKLKQLKPEYIDHRNLGELEPYTARMCFLCDPAAFAHRICPQRAMMINAKMDPYFSRKSTLLLWEQLGKPEIHWLAKFHSSKIITQKTILDKVFGFFEK